MPNTPLAGLPYPSGATAPAGADQLMALALALDAGGLLTCVDEAERDARYGTAPKGTLVISVDAKAIWVKADAATATWLTVWSDSGDVAVATSAADWDSPLTVRRVGATVYLSAGVRRNGGPLAPGAGWSAPLANLPAPYRPPITQGWFAIEKIFNPEAGSARTLMVVRVDPGGDVTVQNVGGADLATGDLITINHSWLAAG